MDMELAHTAHEIFADPAVTRKEKLTFLYVFAQTEATLHLREKGDKTHEIIKDILEKVKSGDTAACLDYIQFICAFSDARMLPYAGLYVRDIILELIREQPIQQMVPLLRKADLIHSEQELLSPKHQLLLFTAKKQPDDNIDIFLTPAGQEVKNYLTDGLGYNLTQLAITLKQNLIANFQQMLEPVRASPAKPPHATPPSPQTPPAQIS